MKTINRNKIQRMIDGFGTYSSGGSGGVGGDMPAGIATQAWTMENFLSIEFFTKLFKAYGPAETEGDPDVEIVPNDVEGEISNIQAMFGFWTEQYISALGQGSGGGGGGGDLNEPLASINTAGLATHPGSAGQTIVWNGSAWVYGSVLNQGVTSVGLSAPTGFNVTGSPITSSGTLALSFASGYELPLAADTAKGVTAYGWGDHSIAGYALASNVYSKTDADAKFLTIAFFRSLFKAYTSASAEVVPNAGDTTTISSIKAMFGFWTEQYISALGQGSGGGGGVTLNEPLNGINNASLGSPSSAGQTLVWNGSAWKYSSATGISATSLNVGGSASISGALSVAGNITTSAGGFIVSGKDDTYVLLAGGGTKLLSEIGGGGAVNSITIGQSATVYSPDANGNVNIPPYPSTANLVSGISLNGDVVQPSSGIAVLGGLTKTVKVGDTSYSVSSAGVVSLPAYPTKASWNYDDVYLKLSGGTLSSSSYAPLKIDSSYNSGSTQANYIQFYKNGTTLLGDVGYFSRFGMFIQNEIAPKYQAIVIKDDGTPCYYEYDSGDKFYKLWNAANDGSGSGLDADLLDGQHGSYYATAADYLPLSAGINKKLTNALYINYNGISAKFGIDSAGFFMENLTYNNWVRLENGKFTYKGHEIWNEANDGSGSGLDADLLDGQHGSYYAAASSLADYLPLTGGTLTSTSVSPLTIKSTATPNASYITFSKSASKAWVGYDSSCHAFLQSAVASNQGALCIKDDGIPYFATYSNAYTFNKLWHEGNDGAGSGLDADLLDGQHGSYYAAASDLNNYLPLSGGTMSGAIYFSQNVGGFISADSTGFFMQSGNNYWIYVKPSNGIELHGKTEVTGYLYSTKALRAGGSSGIYIGSKYDGSSNDYDVIERATSSGDLYINYYTTGRLSLCYGGGNVCISKASASYKLDVNGVIYSDIGVYSAGYVTALSDIRKKDVKEYMNMDYGIVADAPMIKFTWKDGRCDGKLQVGSIAQYWQKALPEAVSEMADGELSMSYGVIALLSSIATARKVRDHEKRIAELENENKMLHRHIADLQKYNNGLNG